MCIIIHKKKNKYKLRKKITDYSTFHQRNMSNCEALNRPIENSIKGKLEAALKPLHCNVINESYMHNVPKNSETHFKVVVVSEKFDKQPLIKTPDASVENSALTIATYHRGQN
ncbi:uncharacterized protein LOC105201346 isoform X5 [Solenopsis invicta]|uniref:uncharacterized protein LOC105201346 isoform X5 n=1 Tax=Solenopsis invicta TaxID=13686 RepID=UPI00193CA5D9|nr:uncharacterized protein LOC105201346 isoform X5 [Solenopsis invicta]